MPLSAIRSLGDLRTRVVGGKETMNYWDIEHPRFALAAGSGLAEDRRAHRQCSPAFRTVQARSPLP